MNEKKSFLSVKEMVEMALLISLAVVLDLDGLKISLGANGGSIGFTMLPLFILAFRHGFIKSVIGIGIIYGLVTNLLDGWGLVYYPFDYFVAYGLSIPLVGLFSRYVFNKRAAKDNLLIVADGLGGRGGYPHQADEGRSQDGKQARQYSRKYR